MLGSKGTSAPTVAIRLAFFHHSLGGAEIASEDATKNQQETGALMTAKTRTDAASSAS
jgi:hypothetical protein